MVNARMNKIKVCYWFGGFILFLFIVLPNVLPNSAGAVSYWVNQTGDNSGVVGGRMSLVLDDSNYAHISYYDGSTEDLKYATNSSGSWVRNTVDDGGVNVTVGDHSSIAYDNTNNKALFSYYYYNYDTFAEALRYATGTPGSWTIETVDSTGSVGGYTSIAYTSATSKVHISYYDGSNGNLKYAQRTPDPGGSWTIEAVDSTADDVGYYTSLEIDGSNNAHFSYLDGSNGNLKYATGTLGAWNNETVDGTTWLGSYTSLALDGASNVHISYFDDTNGYLKYATGTLGAWTIETVDTTGAGSTGFGTSIVIDSDNNVHISYDDAANGDVKYAKRTPGPSGSWTIQTVNDNASVGGSTSIALDNSNNPHISYLDTNNGYLKYALLEPANTTGTGWIDLTDEHAGLANYDIKYDSITGEGMTRVLARTTDISGAGSFLSDPEVGYMLDDTVRDLTYEDFTFTGFTVRIPYDPADIPAGFSESQLRLFHYLGSGNVEDITTSVNTALNYIEGYATSMSDFGVGLNPEPATLLLLLLPLGGLAFKRKLLRLN